MDRPLTRRAALTTAAVSLALPRPAFAQSDAESLVRRFYAAALTSDGDLSELDGLLAADFAPMPPSDEAMPGIDAYRQRRATQRQQLADLGFDAWAYRIDDLMASGDRVAVRATQLLSFMGVPESSAVPALAWFEVADGRIARMWSEQDDGALFGS